MSTEADVEAVTAALEEMDVAEEQGGVIRPAPPGYVPVLIGDDRWGGNDDREQVWDDGRRYVLPDGRIGVCAYGGGYHDDRPCNPFHADVVRARCAARSHSGSYTDHMAWLAIHYPDLVPIVEKYQKQLDGRRQRVDKMDADVFAHLEFLRGWREWGVTFLKPGERFIIENDTDHGNQIRKLANLDVFTA